MAKIQNQDVKSLSDLTGAGATKTSLINTDKIYTAKSDDQLETVLRKNDFSATAAPTVSDDTNSGFEVGSVWIDTTNDAAYVCLDASAGAAVWQLVGSGTGTGGGALNFYSEGDMEDVELSDFSKGNNAVAGGGGADTENGTLALETGSPLRGTTSLKYTLNATPGSSDDDFVLSDNISIPLGYRDRFVAIRIDSYTYDGADDDLKLIVANTTTNDVPSITSDDILSKSQDTLKAASNGKAFVTTVFIPAGCTQIRMGFQVATHASGSEVFTSDDWKVTPDLAGEISLRDNEFSAIVRNNGTASVESENVSWVKSVTTTATGRVEVLFNDGLFSERPNITVTPLNRERTAQIVHDNTYDKTEVNIQTQITSTSTDSDTDFIITAQRAGADYAITGEHIVTPTDSVAVSKYKATTGESVANATVTFVDFDTKIKDNDGLVLGAGSGNVTTTETGFRWVAPRDGEVDVRAQLRYGGSATFDTDEIVSIFIYKNGSQYSFFRDVIQSTPASYEPSPDISDIVTVAKGDYIEIATEQNAGETRTLSSGGGNFVNFSYVDKGILSAAIPVQKTAYLKDVKAPGTNGGTFTSGAWQTRDLNTVEGDSEIVSLSSNQFTLQPGKYNIEASAPAYQALGHQIRLLDTGASIKIVGSVEAAADTITQTNRSFIAGQINLSAATTFEIQHQGELTQTTNGFGRANSFDDEVYTQVKITKIK